MLRRYLPPTIVLLLGLSLVLVSGVRSILQRRTTPLAGLEPTTVVVSSTTVVPTTTPTKTPLYVPSRTPVTATALPVTPSPTVTPVPLVTPTDTPTTQPPTNTPLPTETATELVVISTEAATSAENTPIPTATPLPTNTPPPTATPLPTETPFPIDPNFNITYRERFGVSGAIGDAASVRAAGLNYGSFLTWNLFDTGRLAEGVTPWQMVRVAENGLIGGLERLGNAVRANPGGIFVIGNEPDVGVQDNTTAPSYAETYHEVYYYIKGIDPTAQVAIAGVASPTPLRLFYLDLVLQHYEQTYGEKMPIDIWTIHIYVLREERDSWGVGIPTGLGGVDEGELYEIDDHKNSDIANQLLLDFRWWMAENGYRNTPLAITEFGILLPADYGFPPEVVSNYMTTLVNFYLSATGETGYPSDGNRLVQWWFWFSIRDREQFEVSDLLNEVSGELTPAGRTYSGYIP